MIELAGFQHTGFGRLIIDCIFTSRRYAKRGICRRRVAKGMTNDP